jgi:hypothetical protein
LDEPTTLVGQFFNRPEIHAAQRSEAEYLVKRLHEYLRVGVIESDFRKELTPKDSVESLFRGGSFSQPKIRLCCCRYGRILVILGNGCLKKSRSSQEDPEYHGMLLEMQSVDKLLLERLKNREIMMEDNGELVGKLTFEIL